MTAWAARLGALGEVVRFDYPYMERAKRARPGERARRAPDRLPVLLEAHRQALAAARAAAGRTPVVLAGKSMGARVACHLAGDAPVAAVVCLGYPLRGASGALRDGPLLALRTPVLFVQGTRDALCPLPALEEVRRRMTAPSTLHVVPGGDHSLRVGVRALVAAGEDQEAVDARAADAVRSFLLPLLR
jgi:predicted alpha/beta-hydrolase family hydrolase